MCACSVLLAVPQAWANHYVVRTETELIQAIQSINQSSSRNTIDIRATGTLTLTAPLPAITGDVEITGPGKNRLTISGDNQYRVLFVDGGTVSIEDFTIADGFDRGGDGAVGKDGGAGGGAAGMGGGLFVNSGDVTLKRVDFVNCSAIGGNGGERFPTGSSKPGNDGGGGGAGMAGDGLLNSDDDLGGDGGPSDALGGLEGLGGGRGQAGADGGEGAGAGGGGKGRSFFFFDGVLAVSPDDDDDSDDNDGKFGEPGGNGGHGGYGAGGGGGGEAGKGNERSVDTSGSVMILSDSSSGAAGGDGGAGGFGGGAGAGGRGRSGGNNGQAGLGGVFGGSAGLNGHKAGGGGGAGLGGALFIRNGSRVALSRCSLSDNVASGGAGGQGIEDSNGENGLGKGGAIFIDFNTRVTLSRVTFANNVASDSLGISNDNDNVMDFRMLATASSGSSGPCFIASAAYGTPLTAEIDVLRGARDTYLLNHAFGAAFVDAYYRFSPPIADKVAQNSVIAAGVRTVLWPITWLTNVFVGYPGFVAMSLILALLLMVAPGRATDRVND
ncbi:MAG: hypothetical protein IID08_03610 [Candidatus Hydrogenedentes bacterium]|nr:hypothetical protein [Candidatus Hydrogenedentota bacterium]